MTRPESSEAAQILERLRRQIAAVRGDDARGLAQTPGSYTGFEGRALPSEDLSSLRVEVETAYTGHRDFGQLNPRRPGPLNALIQFFKKVMRRSLSWYTRPQHVFQSAVIRALRQIITALEAQNDELRELQGESSKADRLATETRRNLDEQRDQLRSELRSELQNEQRDRLREGKGLVQRLDDLQQSMADHSQRFACELEAVRAQFSQQYSDDRRELLALMQRQRSRERDVRRLVNAIGNGGASATEVGQGSPLNTEAPEKPEFDYFAFEERYRGDEKLIRDRQREYLKYFQGRSNVVDLGCGRGEFLDLLRESGITAGGVEAGLDQVLLCREKGLDVTQQDLFTFMESLPDGSIGGVFSAQVIEHLAPADQLRLVALTYRKTGPGSPVIFETINAQSVYAIVKSFLLDPTHVRLVPPELLKFAMESLKFRDVQLKFLAPVPEHGDSRAGGRRRCGGCRSLQCRHRPAE